MNTNLHVTNLGTIAFLSLVVAWQSGKAGKIKTFFPDSEHFESFIKVKYPSNKTM